MIIDSDLILYNSDYPINKFFWVVEDFDDMIHKEFKYLQAYDLINGNKNLLLRKKTSRIIKINKKNEEEMKSNQITGFQLISFPYNIINEIHKRRFLHQNNAIEIFLKTGLNYYLSFNKVKGIL